MTFLSFLTWRIRSRFLAYHLQVQISFATVKWLQTLVQCCVEGENPKDILFPQQWFLHIYRENLQLKIIISLYLTHKMLRCVKDQSVNSSYLIMQRSPLLCSSTINSGKSLSFCNNALQCKKKYCYIRCHFMISSLYNLSEKNKIDITCLHQ